MNYKFKRKQILVAAIFISLLGLNAKGLSQTIHKSHNHVIWTPENIKWEDGPVSLPAGAQKALLEGDPKNQGLFTIRLKLPAGYKIMPHRHTADEHVTVIKGTFYMGVGEKFDEEVMMQIPAGGFALMQTGTPHYGFAKQGCIIQVHGMGPWEVIYVNPNDDPRIKK